MPNYCHVYHGLFICVPVFFSVFFLSPLFLSHTPYLPPSLFSHLLPFSLSHFFLQLRRTWKCLLGRTLILWLKWWVWGWLCCESGHFYHCIRFAICSENSRCDRQFDLTTIICCETLFHFLSLSLALCLLGFSWIWEGIIRNCCVNMLINKPIIVRQSHATVLSISISTFPHISPSYFIVCRSTMRMVLCFLSSSSIRGQLNLRTVSINKFNQSTSWCSRNMTKSS